MQARLQRRVQRQGWDLAAGAYEAAWQAQLARAHGELLELAHFAPGERVLDVACGTGLVALEAARAVGPAGSVLGIDVSGQMVDAATQRAQDSGVRNASFARMDAEALDLPDAGFDLVLCALGLMYMPDPAQALREMRRVLRPRGRLVAAVWGERAHCAWSAIFPIVEAEVASDVCPLFFQLGNGMALSQRCAEAKFEDITHRRIAATLHYACAEDACTAAFVGGPVALAWNRFDASVRGRVRARYLEAIAPWRRGAAYSLPGEFVIVGAVAGR